MLVRSFADRGFLVLDDIGIDGFEATADRVRAEVGPLHEDGKYNRVIDAWTTSEAVHTVATARRVMELLEVLYGHRPIPFQTLSFLRGSQQRTHSDTYHFHSYPKHFMCGVTARTSGQAMVLSTTYYPGSHRLPDYDFLCPHRNDEMWRS
jgi:hypothetical protein